MRFVSAVTGPPSGPESEIMATLENKATSNVYGYFLDGSDEDDFLTFLLLLLNNSEHLLFNAEAANQLQEAHKLLDKHNVPIALDMTTPLTLSQRIERLRSRL